MYYVCENCEEKHFDDDDIFECENCGNEICIRCGNEIPRLDDTYRKICRNCYQNIVY